MFPSCQPEGRGWLREHGTSLQAVERKRAEPIPLPFVRPNRPRMVVEGTPPVAAPGIAASHTKPPLLPMVKVAPPSVGLLVGLLPDGCLSLKV